MTDWQKLAEMLVVPLRSSPCRCQLGPWAKRLDGRIDRVVAKQCSKCAAVAAYDAAQTVAIKLIEEGV